MNVVLSCMISEFGENSQFGVNTIISLAYIKQSWVYLWEPRQNNLSNPEVCSEPCQKSKIVFCKNNHLFFVKHFILDVWQDSEYASVICYSLFRKIEGANKTDLVAMEVYSF